MKNVLAQLVERYPNDSELGSKVRSLVLQFGKEIDEVYDIKQQKVECAKNMEFEKCAELRNKERDIINKIRKHLGLMAFQMKQGLNYGND